MLQLNRIEQSAAANCHFPEGVPVILRAIPASVTVVEVGSWQKLGEGERQSLPGMGRRDTAEAGVNYRMLGTALLLAHRACDAGRRQVAQIGILGGQSSRLPLQGSAR